MSDTRSVQECLVAVMRAVGGLGKHQRNTGPNGYNFRGIDAVMNAVGPALREAGLVVVPDVREYHYGEILTGRDRRPMGHARVVVTYTFVAPDGSTLACSAPGEAFDSGDKATPKAMSVAFRTALLQALCLPTDEPDPDEVSYERTGHQPPPPTLPPETGEVLTTATRGRLFTLLTERGIIDPDAQRSGMARVLGRPIASPADLTESDARTVIASLEGR